MKNKFIILAVSVLLYMLIKHFVPFGRLALYPVILLVTFLHEFGHSIFAVATGGSVSGLQVNPDGSGYAMISGGWTALVLMGGYIGSALFGNVLLYIGLRKDKLAKYAIYVLSAALMFSAFWWFESFFTRILLLLFAGAFVWLSKASQQIISAILILIGSASVIYIIEDFNVGPSSDLARFTQIIPILPQFVWAIVWLLMVLFLTYLTIKRAIVKSRV